MAEWIPVYVLLSPLAFKLIQLRVFQYEKGVFRLEFGRPLRTESKTAMEKRSANKPPRKQVRA